MTDTLVLQFSTTSAWQSSIIRRICHSPFSHVDLVLDDGSLLGASDPGGVKIRPSNYEVFKRRNRVILRTANAANIVDRAKSQIGKPFDSAALYAFLSDIDTIDRNWREEGQWFCAELVAWCLEQEQFWSYPIVTPKRYVSPPDLLLLLNPYFDVDQFWHDQTFI